MNFIKSIKIPKKSEKFRKNRKISENSEKIGNFGKSEFLNSKNLEKSRKISKKVDKKVDIFEKFRQNRKKVTFSGFVCARFFLLLKK